MATTQQVETVSTGADKAKMGAAIALVIAGLAGFYLLEARDLNEAIQAAGKIPPARYGCVEVRPIRELDPAQFQPR